MKPHTHLDTAIALVQEQGRIDPDLQIVQLVHQQAVQARRDLADAYWASFAAFIRRQRVARTPRAALAATCAVSSTQAGGAPCPR